MFSRHAASLQSAADTGPGTARRPARLAKSNPFQAKEKSRKKKVLILDASREFKTGRAQNELLPEHVERIHGWYRDFKDVEGVARVVTLDDIAANSFNLNIPRYVEPKTEQETLSVEEAMNQLRESAVAVYEAEDKLISVLKKERIIL